MPADANYLAGKPVTAAPVNHHLSAFLHRFFPVDNGARGPNLLQIHGKFTRRGLQNHQIRTQITPHVHHQA